MNTFIDINRVLKASAWWMIHAPLYDKISFKRVWGYVQEVPELMEYFSDYSENIIPDKTCLFTILSKIRKAELKELIKKTQANRAVQNEEDKEQMIEIRCDICYSWKVSLPFPPGWGILFTNSQLVKTIPP